MRARFPSPFFVQELQQYLVSVHAKVASFAEADARLDKFFAEVRAQGPADAAKADALDMPEERKRLIHGG
jgi:hypothetical protein